MSSRIPLKSVTGSVDQRSGRPWFGRFGQVFGNLIAWTWTIIAGGGGLGLIITRGPWPLTNGWFALFSGITACPLTAWLLKKSAGITLPGWARFAIAFLFVVVGRLVLRMEGRGSFLPNFS